MVQMTAVMIIKRTENNTFKKRQKQKKHGPKYSFLPWN